LYALIFPACKERISGKAKQYFKKEGSFVIQGNQQEVIP